MIFCLGSGTCLHAIVLFFAISGNFDVMIPQLVGSPAAFGLGRQAVVLFVFCILAVFNKSNRDILRPNYLLW